MLGILGYNDGVKKPLNFPDQVNVLCPADTRRILVAIAYFRGEKGRYAGPAKDFILEGIARFKSGLSPTDKRAFDEILDTVKTTEAIRNG